jgi:ribosomal protein S27E
MREIQKRYYDKHPEKIALRAKKLAVFCPNCATYTMTRFQRPKEIRCSMCGNILHNPKPEMVTKNIIYKSRESYLKKGEEVKA